MTDPWYATREHVKRALDAAETARANTRVDRALGTASRTVEGLLHRKFYPQVATRYFDWPNRQYARPWRLWLDADEVISVTTLTVAGVVIPATDYFLEPANSGPPYNRIEIDLASPSAFTAGQTHQRAVAVAGVFGYRADEEQVGGLAAALAAAGTSTAVVSWTDISWGVGDVLRIDDERMVITARSMVDSMQNLGGAGLAASAADVAVPVSAGTGYAVDETILIDSERMLIVDIAGNILTVKRAWDGTVLAAHTPGADIYGLTGIELARGQCGTAAAAHADGTAIYRHVVPDGVRDLTVAYALNQLLQQGAGYARIAGSGENAREFTGRGIRELEDDVRTRYGRQARTRAV